MSGGIGFERLRIRVVRDRDFDATGLHGLGDDADEVDMKEPVLQGSALDLDMLGKLEATLESTSRNAAMEEPVRFAFRLAALALDGQHVLARFDGQFAVLEARDGHGDAVGVVARSLDIVGRVALGIIDPSGSVQHLEQAVEADGGTIQRGKINVTHGECPLDHRATCVMDGVRTP